MTSGPGINREWRAVRWLLGTASLRHQSRWCRGKVEDKWPGLAGGLANQRFEGGGTLRPETEIGRGDLGAKFSINEDIDC